MYAYSVTYCRLAIFRSHHNSWSWLGSRRLSPHIWRFLVVSIEQVCWTTFMIVDHKSIVIGRWSLIVIVRIISVSDFRSGPLTKRMSRQECEWWTGEKNVYPFCAEWRASQRPKLLTFNNIHWFPLCRCSPESVHLWVANKEEILFCYQCCVIVCWKKPW